MFFFDRLASYMSLKPLYFFAFLCFSVFMLFGNWGEEHRKVSLLLKSPGKSLNHLVEFNQEEIDENTLEVSFFFQSATGTETNYFKKNKRLEITFYNVSRSRFKKLLRYHPKFFRNITLAHVGNHSYRVTFNLKPNIIPLPFKSNNRKRAVKFSFSSKFEDKLHRNLSKKPRLKTNSPMGHLSKTYLSNQTKTKFIPEYKKQSKLSTYKFQREKIEPGLEKFELRTKYPRNRVYGLKLHRSVLKDRIQIGFGEDKLLGTQTTSEISKSNEAIAAINGSFFKSNGNPIGLIIKDYKLLSVPVFARSCFGISREGKALISRPHFQGEVVTEKGIIKMEGLNQSTPSDANILFTHEFGLKPADIRNSYYLVFQDNSLLKVSESAPLIPRNGTVLRVDRDRFPWVAKLSALSRVILSYGLSAPWNSMKLAIGGGPKLLHDGLLAIDYKEQFSKAIIEQRAPRTAIGIDDVGNLILVVVDGRQTLSKGLTMLELADLMHSIGARQAMNLDGGGSSTLFLDGKVVNKPSDGHERKVSNAILFMPAFKESNQRFALN